MYCPAGHSESETQILTNTGKSDYRRYQYGGSFGGPIIQSKLQQTQSSVNRTYNNVGASFTDPSSLTTTADGISFNFWESAVITRNNGGRGWYATNAPPSIWGNYVTNQNNYLYEVAHKGINSNPN